MHIKQPELPYDYKALEPHISKETIDFHYGKHHKAYVDKLNNQIQGSKFQKATLEEIVKNSKDGLFNQAAQVWNHNFYWYSLSPKGGGDPNTDLKQELEKFFGSIEQFKKEFTAAALSQFGSGWAWLIKESNALTIVTSSNADTPLAHPTQKALLTCDVWEHAYYIDYRNARNTYLDAFWNIVNWDFVNKNLDS